jgi:hypothetical protein
MLRTTLNPSSDVFNCHRSYQKLSQNSQLLEDQPDEYYAVETSSGKKKRQQQSFLFDQFEKHT